MEEKITEEVIVEQEVTESPLMTTISDVASSFLQIAQENVMGRIQEMTDDVIAQVQVAATEIVQNAVILFIIVLLGLIGFIFTIVGLSLWLGDISGFGAWFGFLIVGIIIFIIALVAGLMQKNKQC